MYECAILAARCVLVTGRRANGYRQAVVRGQQVRFNQCAWPASCERRPGRECGGAHEQLDTGEVSGLLSSAQAKAIVTKTMDALRDNSRVLKVAGLRGLVVAGLKASRPVALPGRKQTLKRANDEGLTLASVRCACTSDDVGI